MYTWLSPANSLSSSLWWLLFSSFFIIKLHICQPEQVNCFLINRWQYFVVFCPNILYNPIIFCSIFSSAYLWCHICAFTYVIGCFGFFSTQNWRWFFFPVVLSIVNNNLTLMTLSWNNYWFIVIAIRWPIFSTFYFLDFILDEKKSAWYSLEFRQIFSITLKL